MSCPMCRKKFTIPDDGLSALPKNFYVEKLLRRRNRSTGQKAHEKTPSTLLDKHVRNFVGTITEGGSMTQGCSRMIEQGQLNQVYTCWKDKKQPSCYFSIQFATFHLLRDASAERGYEIVCRLSVRPSVRP